VVPLPLDSINGFQLLKNQGIHPDVLHIDADMTICRDGGLEGLVAAAQGWRRCCSRTIISKKPLGRPGQMAGSAPGP